jgi:putative transposase
MTNQPRRFMDGNYYHVFQRGNHKDVVFREVPDRVRFLSKLDEYCDRDQQSLIAYCLMDNHYHLALRQDGEQPISVTMRSLLQEYAQYYNRKYGTVGSLFQGRFQSRLVDHPLYNPWHLARLSRYIHRNPLPFADFAKYRWSSYRQYVGGGRGACDIRPVLELFGGKASYATFCAKAPPSERSKQSEPETQPRPYRVMAGRRLANHGLLG